MVAGTDTTLNSFKTGTRCSTPFPEGGIERETGNLRNTCGRKKAVGVGKFGVGGRPQRKGKKKQVFPPGGGCFWWVIKRSVSGDMIETY